MTGAVETEWRDYEVTMTLYVNIPIHAANPDFTAEDAKEHAIEHVVGAIEAHTHGDAEVASITAVEE
jgi:hypothetical protein